MTLMFIPYGPFAADAALYHNPANGTGGYTPTANNVVAFEAQTGGVIYIPFPTMAAYTNALNARCQGAFSLFSSSGAVNIFAGTVSKLYQLTVASSSWVDVTHASGAYGTNSEDWWNFTPFGDQLIATNFNDNVQGFTVGVSSVFTDLAPGKVNSIAVTAGGTGYTSPPTVGFSGGGGTGFTGTAVLTGTALTSVTITNGGINFSVAPALTFTGGGGTGAAATATIANPAPRAKYCATVKDFLFLAYTVDAINGTRPQRIWWSAIGDPTTWPTIASNVAAQLQSDEQDIVGDNGVITGLFANIGHSDCIVFFERAIYAVNYVGPSAIFSINPVIGAKGSTSPKSIVREGANLYYYGEDGFRVFDGSTSQPIGRGFVDAKIKMECRASDVDRIVGATEPNLKCIVWAYPGLGSSNGIPNTLLIYNWSIDKWTTAAATTEFLFRGITFGFSLEGLAALYPNLESVPFSLDSPVWANNVFVLAGFDPSHKLSYFSGEPGTMTVETPHFCLGDGQTVPTDTRGLLRDTRPIFDGTSTVATVQAGHRETLNDPMSYGTAVSTNVIGSCPQRVSGRYLSAKTSVSGASLATQLLGVECDVVSMGRR